MRLQGAGRAAASLLVLCTLGATQANSGDGRPASPRSIYRYVSPQRTSVYEFTDKGANLNYIDPRTFLPGQTSQAHDYELGGGAITHDCSDEWVRCLAFDISAIAIPRDGLTPDSTYTADGNLLKVIECFRGKGRVCQVALIQSNCFSYEGRMDKCIVVPPDKQKDMHDYQLYFIYNEDFGVTSFGFTMFGRLPPNSESEKMSIATEYVLEGDEGLLKR